MSNWDRKKRESRQAWEAFCIYRDQENRSMAGVARGLHKSRALMGRWAKRWNWSTRVFDYDVYIEHLSRKSLEKKRIEMAEPHLGNCRYVRQASLQLPEERVKDLPA